MKAGVSRAVEGLALHRERYEAGATREGAIAVHEPDGKLCDEAVERVRDPDGGQHDLRGGAGAISAGRWHRRLPLGMGAQWLRH
jgi:hypothetical protein